MYANCSQREKLNQTLITDFLLKCMQIVLRDTKDNETENTLCLNDTSGHNTVFLLISLQRSCRVPQNLFLVASVLLSLLNSKKLQTQNLG